MEKPNKSVKKDLKLKDVTKTSSDKEKKDEKKDKDSKPNLVRTKTCVD